MGTRTDHTHTQTHPHTQTQTKWIGTCQHCQPVVGLFGYAIWQHW